MPPAPWTGPKPARTQVLTLEPGHTAAVEHLTLEPGSYRLTVEYAAEDADGLLVVESPGDLQPDNTAGLCLARVELPAGGGSAEAELEVPRRLTDLVFRTESGQGTLTLSHADLSGGAVHRDEAVLFALAALGALALAAAGMNRLDECAPFCSKFLFSAPLCRFSRGSFLPRARS